MKGSTGWALQLPQLLPREHFPATEKEIGTPPESSRFPELRRQESSWGPIWLKFAVWERSSLHGERTLESYRALHFQCSAECWSSHEYEETTKTLGGKKTIEKEQAEQSLNSRRAEKSLSSHQFRVETSLDKHGHHQMESSEGDQDQIRPRMKAIWTCLNSFKASLNIIELTASQNKTLKYLKTIKISSTQ